VCSLTKIAPACKHPLMGGGEITDQNVEMHKARRCGGVPAPRPGGLE